MPYLIDGHNLIAQLPDIDIADPHDEAKLVLKLRSFVARTQKKIIIVFDSGIPAGLSNALSTYSIKVRFASPSSNADAELMVQIKQITDPQNWTLVSSDQEVIQKAKMAGMQHTTAHAFVNQLKDIGKPNPSKKSSRAKTSTQKQNPHLSKAELDEWLALFGVEDSDKDDWLGN